MIDPDEYDGYAELEYEDDGYADTDCINAYSTESEQGDDDNDDDADDVLDDPYSIYNPNLSLEHLAAGGFIDDPCDWYFDADAGRWRERDGDSAEDAEDAGIVFNEEKRIFEEHHEDAERARHEGVDSYASFEISRGSDAGGVAREGDGTVKTDPIADVDDEIIWL